jgi:hypothetical protein
LWFVASGVALGGGEGNDLAVVVVKDASKSVHETAAQFVHVAFLG